MKYDLEDILRDAYNEEAPKPSSALNQMTLQKIKDENKNRPRLKYGIKRFAQLQCCVCVSVFL